MAHCLQQWVNREGLQMLTTTAERVSRHTADSVNERICRETDETVARLATAGQEAIDRRLAELDEEWDIERYVETMAPTFSLIGLALGATVNKKWLLFPVVIQSFFLQHALQGWCPPIPVLRRLGVRTMDEINEERYALKVLRGDFRQLNDTGRTSVGGSTDDVMEAVRR
jgi:hypothetical protein